VRRVVVAHSQARIRRRLVAAVRSAGCTVEVVSSPDSARRAAASPAVEALIAELELFGGGGLEALAAWRGELACPLLIVVPARARDLVPAVLDAGADDCFTDEVEARELVARLRAAERHARAPRHDAVHTPDFDIDVTARLVVADGVEVHLTPIEWRLVESLVRSSGMLVPQSRLLADVWGADALDKRHYVRVFMSAIRHKLEPDPAHPRYFLTEPGVGVRFLPQGRQLAARVAFGSSGY
jgi:two-component system, OmpR family, KDP operon response regulator KdpE